MQIQNRFSFFTLNLKVLVMGAKIVLMLLILIVPFKVNAESYFDKMKDKMSDMSNDLIIQAEELSDADIDSISDGITSNIDNVLSIVKDLKNLEEPLEKICFKIKAVKIELGLIPSVKFKIEKTDISNLNGFLDADQFSSFFGNDDSAYLNELSTFQKMFVKMLENLNVIEMQLDEFGYEIGEVETHATIPPKMILQITKKTIF